MITILHGENIVASRKVLNEKIAEARSRDVVEVVRLDGKKVELSEIKQALESSSLFGGDRLVVVEGLLSRSKSKSLTDIADYLRAEISIAKLIIWEGKTLSKTLLKPFSKSQVLEFKPAAVIFKLTDAIRSNNVGQLLTLFKECLLADSAEMVFYMISRQIRLLLQTSSKNFKMAPWQINKLKTQNSKLKTEKVIWMHEQLLLIDERIKKGQSQLGLEGELELLLVKI